MDRLSVKKVRLERRRKRIKNKIVLSDSNRKRLCISKSNKSIYVQVIDDVKGVTLVAMSTLAKDFPSMKSRVNIEAAKALGKLIAEKAKAQGITKVTFDRNGLLYHGRVKAFADAAREHGLEF
ncbi:MAG TPA: 50S ribosomal protein L18 [Spirochaetota bacterium]|nr:50S ribosomal protein L18 [Spirochaetota bacterium]